MRAFFVSIETRNVFPRISRDIVARGTIVWIRKNIHELGVACLFPGKTELQGGMAEPPLSPFCYAGMRNDLLSLGSTPDAQCRLRHESNRTILRRALPPSLPIGHWGERRREKLPTIKQRGGEGDLAGRPEQKRERDRETGEIGNELTRTTRKWDPKHCGTEQQYDKIQAQPVCEWDTSIIHHVREHRALRRRCVPIGLDCPFPTVQNYSSDH